VSTLKTRDRYHHDNLRETLIAAALALLAEGDGTELTLRAVARRAEVSAMAPYRHFADKSALLAAVAEHGFRELVAELAAADRAAEPHEALVAQGAAYVGFACAHPARFRLMFGAQKLEPTLGLRAAGGAAHELLSARVASLVGPERRDDMTLACWSLVHGLASLAVDGQIGETLADPAALARRITGLLIAPPVPSAVDPDRTAAGLA
jgi:AcrR family transcriptional regulator